MSDFIFTSAALANMVISTGFTVLVENFANNNSVAASVMNMNARANIEAGTRHLQMASRSKDETALREYSLLAAERFTQGISGISQLKKHAKGPLEEINCHYGLAICALMRKEWEILGVSLRHLEDAVANFDERIKDSAREERLRLDRTTAKVFIGGLIGIAISWPITAAATGGLAVWAYLKDKSLSKRRRAEIKKREAQLVEQGEEIFEYYGIENREEYLLLPEWSDAWYVVRTLEGFIKSAEKVPDLL